MGHHIDRDRFDPDTVCASIGRGLDDGEALVPPLAQSTTFVRDRVGSTARHQYSRVSNPTVEALETALGRLEDAPPGVCFSSGLAAETALFLSVLRAGDHIVCGRAVYGGTTRLLREVLAGLGVGATFADSGDAGAIREAITPATRLVFVETPANPTLALTDLRALSRVTRAAGVPLAVDNTFLTPVLQRPLDHGADISAYSTTKFIEGHSVATGGALIARDSGLLERLRFIRKCTGSIQTPFNAWLTLNGLRTLPVRVRAQSDAAAQIAAWLSERPEIAAVHYPGLLTGRDRAIADAQHLGRHGAVVTLEIEGGLDAGRRFAERLRLCALAEHVGSVSTLVTHPATMTHADVPPELRRAAGVTDGLLRLSVGLESVESIIADLEQALAIAGGTREEVSSCAVLN